MFKHRNKSSDVDGNEIIKKVAQGHHEFLEDEVNRGIGWIERWKLRAAGRLDGQNGLPKEISENVWMSGYMNKEYNALQERFARLWGLQQNNLEPLYAKEGILLDRIHYNMEQLTHSGAGKRDKTDPDKLKDRKNGEENLSEHIIAKRRSREIKKRNSKHREKIATLKNQIREDYENLIDLSNRIDESNASTLMCSKRFTECWEQRLDIYWRAAVFVHPDKQLMPAVPGMDLEDQEKEHYFEAHRELTEAVRNAIRKYRELNSKSAVTHEQKQEEDHGIV